MKSVRRKRLFDEVLIVFSGGEERALAQTLAGEKRKKSRRKKWKMRKKMPSKEKIEEKNAVDKA